jgi:hypothetical protein
MFSSTKEEEEVIFKCFLQGKMRISLVCINFAFFVVLIKDGFVIVSVSVTYGSSWSIQQCFVNCIDYVAPNEKLSDHYVIFPSFCYFLIPTSKYSP